MVARHFLILIILLATVPASAQEIKFGVKGGLNVATLGDDSGDVESRMGIHAGGFISVPILDKLRLKPEIVYSMQGAQEDFGGDERKYDYLNIPVMAKYMITKNFNIQAGPQLGILLSAKEEANGEELDVKDGLASTDFGMGFGLGYETDDNISLEARYNYGMSNILGGGNGGLSQTNQVIQLSLGIAF